MFRHVKKAAATAAVAAILLAGLVGLPSAATAASNDLEKADVWIKTSRMSLVEGQFTGDQKGTAAAPIIAVGEDSQKRAFQITATDKVEATRTASYQVVMQGQPTGIWLRVTMRTLRGAWVPSCDFFRGNPATGGTRWDEVGFTCAPRQNASDRSTKTSYTTFEIELNRDAEASGVLMTKGDITLVDGKYDFNNLPYRVAGAATLAKNSRTNFAVVKREFDSGVVNNLARVRFHYRIVDNGKPTNNWVVGWSQTERNSSFQHQAMCFVTQVDPTKKLPATGTIPPLDAIPREQVTPYECRILSEDTIWGNGSYHTELEVSKRPMTIVPASETATGSQILTRYCSVATPDCNVSLASAVRSTKELGNEKYSVSNTTSTLVQSAVEVSETHGTSQSYGVEITASAESPEGVWGKFALSVTNTYTFETSFSSTFSRSFHLDPPPYTRRWVKITIPVVIAEGDIMVYARDTGVYYLLEGVAVEFSDPSRGWDAQVQEEKLPRPAEASVPPTPESTEAPQAP